MIVDAIELYPEREIQFGGWTIRGLTVEEAIELPKFPGVSQSDPGIRRDVEYLECAWAIFDSRGSFRHPLGGCVAGRGLEEATTEPFRDRLEDLFRSELSMLSGVRREDIILKPCSRGEPTSRGRLLEP